ncbi:MAG: hypothetical protein V4560_12895 [Bacteroidota bacterium]
MKKAFILFLFVTGSISVMAQLKRINPTQVQAPASRVNVDISRQQTDLRKELAGKDLKIVLASIDKNSSNFAIAVAGIYTINFDLINSGTEDIDITGVGVQGYLNNAAGNVISAQGGYTLKTGAPNFPANPVLHPGEKYQGKLLERGFDPSYNNGNKLVIKVDNSNAIAETNENNNTLEIPVTGKLESWSTPLPDLTFQINQIAPVTGSTFLNTSLDVSVVNIGAGEIPIDIVQQIIPLVQVYPAGSPGTNLYNEAFPFATRRNGNQTYPGYYTANGSLKPGDKVRIGGSVHVNGLTTGANIIFHFTISTLNNIALPETNTTNNTVDYLYTVK